MNDLIVKEVEFCGDNIIVVKENETSKIYIGISYICNGIGLTENQKDSQVKKIQNDIILNSSCKMLPVKFDGQIRNVLCIELDYLPLWLAKISITSKMQENNPEVVQKLIEYQLKAKDVLAKAFIEQFQIPETYSQALKLAATFAEQAEKYQLLMSTNNAKDMDEVANILKIPKFGRNKLFYWLRQNGILMDGVRKNIPYSQYSKYFEVIEIIRGTESFSKTLVRPKGIEFLIKILKKKGMLQSTPTINRWN